MHSQDGVMCLHHHARGPYGFHCTSMPLCIQLCASDCRGAGIQTRAMEIWEQNCWPHQLPAQHRCIWCMHSLCRFVPQDSELWQAAHAGVLSTGIAGAVLGFKEEQVARRMGCGGYCGHSYMVSAVQHLAQPLHASMHTPSPPGASPDLEHQQESSPRPPQQLVAELMQANGGSKRVHQQQALDGRAHGGAHSGSSRGQGGGGGGDVVEGGCVHRSPRPAPPPACTSWEGRTAQELLNLCIKVRATPAGLASHVRVTPVSSPHSNPCCN